MKKREPFLMIHDDKTLTTIAYVTIISLAVICAGWIGIMIASIL